MKRRGLPFSKFKYSFNAPESRHELQEVQLKLRVASGFQPTHRKTAHYRGRSGTRGGGKRCQE